MIVTSRMKPFSKCRTGWCAAGILLAVTELSSPVIASPQMNVGVSIGVALPRGAVAINVGQNRYYEHRGMYYRKGPHGYYVARPPKGIVIPHAPPNAVRIVIGADIYYRSNGIYYRKRSEGYEVINAPRTVDTPPPIEVVEFYGYQSVWLGEQEYRFKDGQFFQPTPEGLVWVIAPIGAIIERIPSDAVSIWHEEIEYFEVDEVIFRKTPKGYKVVEPPWN